MRRIKITEDQAQILKDIKEDGNEFLKASNHIKRNFKKETKGLDVNINESPIPEIQELVLMVLDAIKAFYQDPSTNGIDPKWAKMGFTAGEVRQLLTTLMMGLVVSNKIPTMKEVLPKIKEFIGVITGKAEEKQKERGVNTYKESGGVHIEEYGEMLDEDGEIKGIEVLNHPPYSSLPDTREEANNTQGLGRAFGHVPSIREPDGMSKIESKEELTGYLKLFQKKFGEEPIFVLDPSEVWYNKVRVINPEFTKWRQEHGDIKAAAMQSMKNLGEEDVDETTTSGSSGAFVPKLGDNYDTHIQQKHYPSEELGEGTTTTSVGGESGTFAYDAPVGDGDDFWTAGNKLNKKITKKALEENAQTDTQWPNGAFVEMPACSKLDNNKEAQNGGCNQGQLPKMKTSKNSVISNESLHVEIAKKTGRSITEVKSIIDGYNNK